MTLGAGTAAMERLLADRPVVHRKVSGEPVCWGLDARVLRWLHETVRPGWRTLETGCGMSTLVLAIGGAVHTCVVPFQGEVDRVLERAREEGIDTGRLTFWVGYSERVLPSRELGDLDLVVIDGTHAFPGAFIDWFYTATALKTGGLLVVDDVHLWTCDVLRQFLDTEPEWERAAEWGWRTVAYRKVADVDPTKDWDAQRFVRERSSEPTRWSRRVRRVSSLVQRAAGGR